jgi:ribosomal protein S18 acetylase RimI-like enzyme
VRSASSDGSTPPPSEVAGLLSTRSTLSTLGQYEISDDPDRVDLDVVHAFLADESYWRRGVRRDVVEAAVRMSLPLSVHLTGAAAPAMVGFARVVTDTATVAWLDDVFVVPAHRRRGLAGALVEAAMAHPAVARTSMQVLLTMDAHTLYARYGFAPFPEPGAFMSRHVEGG